MSYDGRGCRACSGRGWLSKGLEPAPTPVPGHYLEQQIRSAGRPLPVITGPGTTANPRPALTDDAVLAGEKVEPDEPNERRWWWDDRRNVPICDGHHREGDLPYGPIPDAGHPICYECHFAPDEPDDEPQPDDEPNERIRIEVRYPDHPVRLLRVRYGTLSRALAEAFNGRPWR